MANKIHRLGFLRSPTLSISATIRAFSSTRSPNPPGEIKDELSSLPPNPPTEQNGTKLNENTNQAEEEEEEEEFRVYVNEETGEISGPKGPEPTRYGDWERNGRCSDF